MRENSPLERLYNGIIKENPTFVLVLGMCPTLAVTTAAMNGIGMGLTTTVVLAMSNLFISLLRNVIPDKVRMPAYIVVVASIVVNCIILGRAESYASKNGPVASIFDGIGMGLGFTLSITILAAFRELIGAGTLFGFQVMPKGYEPATIFILAPGAFFVLAFLAALRAKLQDKKPKEEQKPVHCMEGGCASCGNTSCSGKFYDNRVIKK